MKRFLWKMAVIAAFAALAMGIQAAWNMHDCPDVRYGPDIAEALRNSFRTFSKARTVLLGDSVAYQMLNPAIVARNGRHDLASLVSNQSIAVLGNRLLLENYLARNPKTRRVVYMVRPLSLNNDGKRKFTFHYLVYPFSKAGLLRRLDAADREQLERRFGRPVLRSKTIRKLLYANDVLYDFYETYLVWEPPIDTVRPVPEANLRNLAAMAETCRRRGIEFHLLPAPLRKGLEGESLYYVDYLSANGFPELAEEYAANLRYLPAEDFLDGVHLQPGPLEEETARMLAHPLLRKR